MKRNISEIDMIIRLFGGIAFANLAADASLTGHAAWPLWAIAIILLATAFTGFCPLYALFHIRTNNRNKHHQ